ncbi:exodeoxyribonuclease V subunit beta [Neisseria sp. ZJ106]|uniref:RecBCD enzyme subunit RecB n=1 Tax=Neisseria lisongii TaxID=2912188 RepID=A0ABY7RKU9_9NEIS|nr:exodeoxyribonuclease V subunit beta [Neisseria lisongii]MCF7522175.1 exodeoxyribonuclease V subunit beta [Neisseria lisongii]WCL72259.1 exodeoxyribonuclease V subunit beta [Neisseria lisongii]
MTSSSARTFDPLAIPIESSNLIEASAGTGKTYGIAALFTRLILLEQLAVDRILVVTFTKAATAELKTRLRARLDEALQVLEHAPDDEPFSDGISEYCCQHHENDEFLPALLLKALEQESRNRLIVRLKAAISRFDNAAIYTIHGFCQRVLRDYAFLCQSPFDVALSENDQQIKLQAAQDFWRQTVSGNRELAGLVFKHRCTPESVLAEIQSYAARPYLTPNRPENRLSETRAAAECNWQNIRQSLADLEQTFWRVHASLNGNAYRKNTFEKVFALLGEASAAGRLPDDAYLHEYLPKFAADRLEEKVKKGQSPDLAAFAKLQSLANLQRDLSAVAEAEQNALTALKLDLLESLKTALAEQKKSGRSRSFDDLLLDVYHALDGHNPHSGQLAHTIAQNWQVALIDEFQDTDPLQYAVFSKIFIGYRNPLFLVGDPKQAIYSFRGADIYAYLQAALDAAHHYTLDTNYRSHSKLIGGINALFQQKKRPFVLPNIGYSDVKAARAESRLSPPQPAIQIRWLNGKNDEVLPKDALRQRAADYCANEIAYALNEAAQGRLKFKERAVCSGDIAVLVRTHSEGSMVAEALKKRGVRSVLNGRQSVFAADEAKSLASLLEFFLDSRKTEALSFVLGGPLFGYTAEQLYRLNHNETLILQWIAAAEAALVQWQEQGIYAAMQGFAGFCGLETSLLKKRNERSLTNYHQLLERLAEEGEHNSRPAALHQWLLDQITQAAEGQVGDNNILRLESDEELVKIVTMHASKGLQYPLVYCPFVWDAADNTAGEWQIIHRQEGSELLAKTQLSENDLTQLGDEETAERLRLLYVALTRSEERLTIYAAAFGSSKGGHATTAGNTFAYLLEGGPDSLRSDVCKAYRDELSANKEAGLTAMLRRNWQRFLDKQSADNTDFAFSDEAPPQSSFQTASNGSPKYRAWQPPQRYFSFIRHTSFTGLARHSGAAAEPEETALPDLDETDLPPAADTDGYTDIHYFPHGAQAGLCLHEMLEHADFNRPAIEQSGKLQEILHRYRFDEAWLPVMADLIDACRQTPLTAGFALNDIAPKFRLPEMGFTMYMQQFSLKALQNWFAASDLPPECRQAAERLNFKDLQGYLNGFIDMVHQDPEGNVCISDYKSNKLGNSSEAYTQTAMNAAMAEHHYYLQAFIYAIAVARYFKQRRQPLHEVNIRYIFLRGIGSPGKGIWSWNIPAESLREWL